MAKAVSSADVPKTKNDRNQIEYFGKKTGQVEIGKPQAFIVPMEPGRVIKTHFHSVQQYQVILSGDGVLGRLAIKPFSLHYTDGFTGYGPLTAGPAGMSYMALRPSTDPGMILTDRPDAREKMKPSPRRHWFQHEIPHADPATLGGLKNAQADTVFKPTEDGAGADCIRLGPDAASPAVDPAGTGGLYVLVCVGSIRFDGRDLPTTSLIWAGPGDAPVSVTAGAQGAALLVLRFPRLEAAAQAA